jgi:hypothetical protein
MLILDRYESGGSNVFILQERAPPLADDFVYMAEVANEYFDRDDLVGMEDLMLNTIEFVIGAPISYRFLRRYSRVRYTLYISHTPKTFFYILYTCLF